jgi:hypothetical protein
MRCCWNCGTDTNSSNGLCSRCNSASAPPETFAFNEDKFDDESGPNDVYKENAEEQDWTWRLRSKF